MAGRDILLEIGTEEIPARFLPRALDDIKTITLKALDEARIAHGEAESLATPSRLTVIVSGVSEQQRDEVREVFGPPKQAAYDKEGNLTKAAEGFARGQGVDPSALVIKDKEGKGEYVCATVEDKGRATIKVLPALLRAVVLSMSFPKSMRWGDGTIRYARPIHWVVALYGGDTVEFDIEGIKSGNMTRGHRFLSPGEIEIKDPSEYAKLLKGAHVVVDQEERMADIEAQANRLASEVGGTPVFGEDMLSIVSCILEYPVAVLCGFEKKYLELPDELLTAVMEGHQKYFPVSGEDGKLMNSFIIVSNTTPGNSETVRAGAERVCRARFEDARFYFAEDRKVSLESRVKDLKDVTFHKKIGSLFDKVMRVKVVAAALAESICPEQKTQAVRAAELSKADLVTGVVFEFPELQGTMGMYYANHDGEAPEVAQAIREQYLPGFSGDVVPDSSVGAVLGLADRADNIASFFGADMRPTGSEDPFALRRQALAIISILGERGYGLSLQEVMAPALGDNAELAADVMGFFEQRAENLLLGAGHAHDIVQAVLHHATKVPFLELYARIKALEDFKSNDKYNDFLLGIKRVVNIIPDGYAPGAKVDRALFKEDDERKLSESFESVRQDVLEKARASDYSASIDALISLTDDINRFFDSVLVMDKDEAVRDNRLMMLAEISATASYVADFSRLIEKDG